MPAPKVRRSGRAPRPLGLTWAAVITLVSVSMLVMGMPAAGAGTPTQNLTVLVNGTGSGTVTSTPPGIDCPSTCTFDFNQNDPVSLAAAPDASSNFDHWSGDCSGSGSCDLTMDVDHNVTAVFTLKTRTLTVSTGGNGSGVVTSSPAGINCGTNCTQGYDNGTDVSLSPNADPGSTFDHWSGDCSGSGSCDVIMTSDQAVTAVFTLTTRTLDVTDAGTGSGTVSSTPGGINSCATSCSHDFDFGTAVSLQANADPSSTFAHWSGDCSGSGSCDVTMNQDHSVGAVFTLKTHTLDVSTSGTGSGTVTSSPSGINCGVNCTQDYDHGTDVSLQAAPDPSSVFDHWTGDCTGSGSCDVTMTQDRSVGAVFTLKLRSLAVTKDGNGSGTVTSAPAGITCDPTCSHNYSHGATVTLTAAPAHGSVFSLWGGDCTGSTNSATCNLSMTQDHTVSATFTLRRPLLTLRKGGDGKGIVTSTPLGINCRIACHELANNFNYGSSVTLHAARGLGSRFTGWRGACTGRAACVVPMTSRRLVTAVFSSVCGRIAFVSTRAGNNDIFTMNSDGTRVINVTRNPADDSDPAWSPDCSRIAFVSDRNGNPDIYVVNTDGTHIHRVTSNLADDTQPTWSPGGSRIAFTRTVGTNGDIYTISPDGTRGRRLTSGPADDFRPDWSPNGLRIAFVSTRTGGQQIFTMSYAGGRLAQVTRSRGQNLQPAWSPSGRRLAFVSTRDGNRELYIANANGSGVIRLTRNGGIDAHPSWSPSGAAIAFYSTRAGNDEIYAIRSNGTRVVDLSRNPASDTGPVWSS